jgi:hypothetical protein
MRTLLRLIPLAVLVPLLGCPTTAPNEHYHVFEGDPDAIISEERPGKRSEVLAMADEATNTIMIFGGNEGPIVNQIPRADYTDETWIFEPGYGWTELDLDEHPSKRGRYAASHDPVNNKTYIFGGRFREPEITGDYDLFRDLWVFDYMTREWERLDNGSNGGPSGRYYPVSAFDPEGQALYVYGGATNANAMFIDTSQEFWKWTAADGWEELSTSGDGPGQRVFYGTSYDSTRNRLVLFAGQVGDFQSMAYNDAFALDLATGVWEELNSGGGNAPFTRMHPAIQYDAPRDRIVLFGGHTDIGDDNDFWELPADGGSWDEVYRADEVHGGLGCLGNGSEVPASFVTQDLSAPERRHRGMHAVMHNNLWIFGGMHSECSDHLDDTWRYDLVDDSWHELIEARTGESCERREDDCECLCI